MKKDNNQLSFNFLSERELLHEEFSGKIKTIIYENPDTGWKVTELVTDSENTIKLAGFLPNISINDRIHLTGTRKTHQRFGDHIQIDGFYKELPFQRESIIKFMISMIDGVGEHLAEKIVAEFRDKTLQVLEENPDQLIAVEGVSKKLIEKIKHSTEHINTTVKELILIGFSPKWSGRIYHKYGRSAPARIKKNPYRLIKDFKGIGFKKAEIIAKKVGIDDLNEERLSAAIYFSLKSSLKKTGHNFIYLEDLKKAVSHLLKLPEAFVESEIISKSWIILEDKKIYLPQYYRAEHLIAGKISKKLHMQTREVNDFDERISSIETSIKINFSAEQKEAIKTSIENPITVITGAAGTGKTTLCLGLTKMLDELNLSYNVCAPTGKAANKLKSVTGINASTIHRMLRYSPSEGYRINEQNTLKADYIIIDEASMVDLLLLSAIFMGINDNARLILIGDPHQIPPVEVGNSLQALIGSYSVSQVVLPEIFRQHKESTILKNAGLINLEKIFPLDETDDFKFININDPIEMINELYENINSLEKDGFHPIKDINVLTPLNKGGGDISVSNLNLRLRDHLNPAEKTELFYVNGREFRMGDKVMQWKNDYDLDIYNGDIGFILNNNTDEKTVEIEFYSDIKSIPYLKMENIALNYAMTVHKAQGSEARAVIFLATTAGCYFLLNKNLFYTAITRAKEKLIMIMPYEVVKMAVRYNIKRQSGLAHRIQQLVFGREPESKG
jgi:exodeoxyribonuclease V alpha subunit